MSAEFPPLITRLLTTAYSRVLWCPSLTFPSLPFTNRLISTGLHDDFRPDKQFVFL